MSDQTNQKKRIDLAFHQNQIADIRDGSKNATIRYELEPLRDYFIITNQNQIQKGAAKLVDRFECQLRNATMLIDYHGADYPNIDNTSLVKQMNKFYDTKITPSTPVEVVIFEAVL